MTWHQRPTWPAFEASPPAEFVYDCRCPVCLATWDAVEPGVCPVCLSPCVVDGLALGPGPGLARACPGCNRVYVKRWTPAEKCSWCRVDLIPA